MQVFHYQRFDDIVHTSAKLEDIQVDPSVHTVALNPQTHQVYLPLEKVGDRPVLRILQPPTHKPDKRSEAKSQSVISYTFLSKLLLRAIIVDISASRVPEIC
jgi:hypothetical protein